MFWVNSTSFFYWLSIWTFEFRLRRNDQWWSRYDGSDYVMWFSFLLIYWSFLLKISSICVVVPALIAISVCAIIYYAHRNKDRKPLRTLSTISLKILCSNESPFFFSRHYWRCSTIVLWWRKFKDKNGISPLYDRSNTLSILSSKAKSIESFSSTAWNIRTITTVLRNFCS